MKKIMTCIFKVRNMIVEKVAKNVVLSYNAIYDEDNEVVKKFSHVVKNDDVRKLENSKDRNEFFEHCDRVLREIKLDTQARKLNLVKNTHYDKIHDAFARFFSEKDFFSANYRKEETEKKKSQTKNIAKVKTAKKVAVKK